MILPVDLLREAKQETGTTSATVAITTALSELVARRRRARLLDVDLPDLTPEALDRLRRPRLEPPLA